MKLSEPQKRVLVGCNRSFQPFRGHQFKTIESLYKRDLVTYEALLRCRVCGSLNCDHAASSKRWEIHVRPTKAGEEFYRGMGEKR